MSDLKIMQVKWDVKEVKRPVDRMEAAMTKYDENGKLTEQSQEVTQVFESSLLGKETGYFKVEERTQDEERTQNASAAVKVQWALKYGDKLLYTTRTVPIPRGQEDALWRALKYRDLGARNFRLAETADSNKPKRVFKVDFYDEKEVSIVFLWKGELPGEMRMINLIT